MKENLIAFWENWIDGEENIDVTENGIILKYCIINKKSKDGVKDWVCFNSEDKLYSFIKYLLLPSIELTRSIGIKESQVYFDVCEHEKTIKLLETFKRDGYEKVIEEYNIWFEDVKKLENNDFDFESIKNYISKINNEANNIRNIFLELQVFKNIKSVGHALINKYEEDNMLDILESKFELSKDEIEDLFKEIDNNKFMLKKITTLLNERFI